MDWDVETYLRYEEERSRPFDDLLARVEADAPRHVVDLGCGPGTLTRSLAERWPDARVEGIDSSPEMLAAAGGQAIPGRLTFREQDVRDWADSEVDVLVSNATLQWVPGHLGLLERLVGSLSAQGWLAFQVPGNFTETTHTALAELRTSPRWRDVVGDGAVRTASVAEPADYLARLAGLGCRVDAWETTYLHVLPGADAVLDWMRGTGLRPVLSALGPGDREEFVEAYAARLRAAYPRQPWGTVLPYRRLFVVARRLPASDADREEG